MKIRKSGTYLVPCLTDFEDRIGSVDNTSEEKYYKNPDYTFRFDQNGVTIFNGVFSGWIGDREVAEILKNEIINSKEVPDDILNSFISYKIIQRDSRKSPQIKEFKKAIRPYYSVLEITDKCNCSCKHCYGNFTKKESAPKLEEIKKRIKKLEELGILFVEVTGGEPLLRDDINEILKFIIDSKMEFGLTTNGYKIEKLSEEVLGEMNSFIISLDGDKEFHEKNRDFPNLYDKAIQSLKKMKNFDCETFVCMTVWNENMHLISDVAKIAQKFNAKTIFQRLLEVGRGKDLDFDEERLPDGEIEGMQKSTLFPPKEKDNIFHFYGCNLLRKDIHINSKGKILPCLYKRDWKEGELLKLDVKSFNEKIQKLKNSTYEKIERCSNCEKNDRCGGPCRLSGTFQSWKN